MVNVEKLEGMREWNWCILVSFGPPLAARDDLRAICIQKDMVTWLSVGWLSQSTTILYVFILQNIVKLFLTFIGLFLHCQVTTSNYILLAKHVIEQHKVVYYCKTEGK